MTLYVKGNNYNYDYEVISASFTNGTLYVIVKDKDGTIFNTSYTKESLDDGIITIM